jgi:hypothetical protein
MGQLGVGGIQRVDGRRSREHNEVGPAGYGLVVGGRHGRRGSSDLANRDHLGAVPAELGGHRSAKEVSRLGLEPLRRDDERLQRSEPKELEHRAPLAGETFGVLDKRAGHRDRCDLATRDLLAFGHRLTVHQREDGDVPQAVDCVDG